MCNFEFEYKDGRVLTVDSINEVVYYVAGMRTEVTNENILTHRFPLTADLQLIGEGCNYSISHNDLLKIYIARGTD